MNTKIKLILILLLTTALSIHGETIDGDSIKLGAKTIPFSEEYGMWTIPENSKKYVCFSIMRPADLKITVSMASSEKSEPLMMLFATLQMHMLCTNYDQRTNKANNQTINIKNVPAGDYKVYIEAQNFISLKIEGAEPDISNTAETLGEYANSFSVSRTCCPGSIYDTYHGAGIADGKFAYRFHISCAMDFSASHSEVSTVHNAVMCLVDENMNMLAENQGSTSSDSIHYTNLPVGTYYVLTGSDEIGELYTNITCKTVRTIDWGESGSNSITERTYTTASGNKWNDRIIYYDEMGREQEIVQKSITPSQKDLVTLNEYDNYGRIVKEWLPVVSSNNGNLLEAEDLKSLSSSLYEGDTHAYGWNIYEPSQRYLKTKEYGAGEPWHKEDKGIATNLPTNSTASSSLDCMKYSVSGNMGGKVIRCEGSYPTGSLLIVETTDEDGHKSYEFKDGFGNVVLKRQEADGEFADTYYIYDAWGHCLAILPPMASREMCMSNKSWPESEDFISSYSYLFAYDNLYRKIGTKLPGCDWAYTIYDNADTPVFTQDGEQRRKGEWSFVLSDVWGRPCLEGICKNALQVGTSLPNTWVVYNGTSGNYGYSVKGAVLESPTFHKTTYYDNYDFLSNSSLGMTSLAYANPQDADYNTVVEERSKGKETGSITAVDGQMDKGIKTVSYYDYRGRNIQTVSTNHLGGNDKLFMAYDFTDHIIKQKQLHTASGKPAFTTDHAYTYDHAGRLLKTTLSINDGSPVTISDMEYDELGRLTAENRNGNDKLRTIYSYNIRQWTKSIAGELFNESLYYDEGHNGATGLYNGNISSMDWGTGDYYWKTRGYGFCYDNLSRLTAASYYEDGKKSDHYSTSYSYDLMGNMQTMTKQGLLDDKSYGRIDDLTYEYNGNQVIKITDKVSSPYYKDAMHFVDGADAEIEYEYDKNGCMTKDLNKKNSKIEYNLLNLPTKLNFADGSTISYSYDADGNKLRADYNLSLMNVINGTSSNAQAGNGVTTHRDYCGNFIYEDGALKMLLFDGGYVTFNSSNSPKYHFYLKDHLGNYRVVADANGNIEQVNHYYPFGGLMAESTGDVQPYKYNGKELDRMHGLDSYDYGARWMSDGRFCTPDPHAINYVGVSPYAYCENNPMNAIDIDGEDIYRIDSYGYISLSQKTKEAQDQLYFGNSNISLDKGILKQLTINRDDYNGNYAVSKNINDITKLFVFVANNTMVEWGLDASSEKSKISYNIRTTHDRNSVSPYNVKNDKNLLFSMHSHSKYSNSHKASGEDVSHIKPGQTVEGYYDFGDVGRYAEMINNFQRVHKGMPFSKLPKALIYDASGKPYPQVFQYTHKKRNFNSRRVSNYKQLINILRQ